MIHFPAWHQRFWPVRTLRGVARRAFFKVLRNAFATDEGRAILSSTLQGQLRWRPTPLPALQIGETVYGELGRLSAPTADRAPIVITARFRTGSTALWSAFRQVPDCTAYYEPLNERRWFDPVRRGVSTDSTHRGVAEYWREYEGLQNLGRFYRDHWTQRDLYMDESSWDPLLREYISILIARAPGRPVLQFNEMDFRLPWLRATFPSIRIIHLYRHPREQWCSSLLGIDSYPCNAAREAFEPHDHFYLERWVRDLRYTFPFLDDERITHPYDQFYLLWRLSYVFSRAYADRSLRYEHLVENPGAHFRALFEWLGIKNAPLETIASQFAGAAAGRWPQYASADWFKTREAMCEQTLSEFFGVMKQPEPPPILDDAFNSPLAAALSFPGGHAHAAVE